MFIEYFYKCKKNFPTMHYYLCFFANYCLCKDTNYDRLSTNIWLSFVVLLLRRRLDSVLGSVFAIGEIVAKKGVVEAAFITLEVHINTRQLLH